MVIRHFGVFLTIHLITAGCSTSVMADSQLTAVTGGIESIHSFFDTVHVTFQVTFVTAASPANGWQFQLFMDTDNNSLTGYPGGFDRLIRGVEFIDATHVYLRQSLGGSGPGGWGVAVIPVLARMTDTRHLMVDLPLGAAGLPTGNFRYTFESYYQGALVDAVSVRTTNQGGEENDCNNNGVDDMAEITSGNAPDCNANGVPDDCDLSSGNAPDCNANDVPDECDISSGASDDCMDNGIPDDCELDCNANGVEDVCDIFIGNSIDCDQNLIPDECTPIAEAMGSRRIAVHPPPHSRPIAIHVRGDPNHPLVNCVSGFVHADGTVHASPVYRTHEDWCTTMIVGLEVIPLMSYTIELLDGTATAPWETAVVLDLWGDANLDGNANFKDVEQQVRAFQKFSTSVASGRLDIAPCVPDDVVDFRDIQATVLAFQRLSYQDVGCLLPCP